MKITVQRETGLGEVTIIKGEGLPAADLPLIYEQLDRRLQQHNAKVVEAQEFVRMVKDPHYRYMFTAFLDSFLGLSSQAGSLLQRFGVKAPEDFDAWMATQREPTPPPVRRIK